MSMSLFFVFVFFAIPLQHIHSSPTFEAHFTKSFLRRPPSSSILRNATVQQYLELSHPLSSDYLTPSCTHLALRQNFSNTIGKPPISVPYSPPSNCTTDYSHVVLEFRVSSKGEQYDRVAAVWLNGAELLRTSTAEPTDTGIFWNIRKDVTRYTSLLSKSNLTLTVMLENLVNDVYTGIYHVNVIFYYYSSDAANAVGVKSPDDYKPNRKLGCVNDHELQEIIQFKGQNKEKNLISLCEKPADLIIPVSGNQEQGFWFRIESENDVHSKGIRIPSNAYKAVIEIYASFHGNDEFWYSNPPDSYIETNNLITGRGHGSYREVLVTIDGKLVGSVIPFPVIFPGGINPLFWEPVVAIGAFHVPSYDFDLTPFLGFLLDGQTHFFGLGVSDSISFWLVDANLHLWLDHGLSGVQAKVLDYHPPALSIERKSVFKSLDGSFKVEAKRKSRLLGWVNSTSGNFTTDVSQDFKFKNSIKFKNNGTAKVVKQNVRTTTEIKVISDSGYLISQSIVQRRYPLSIEISNLPSSKNDAYLMITNVVHGLNEKSKNGDFSSSLFNKQKSNGWMVVKDHDVLLGEAETDQFYNYIDESGCYSRIARAANGWMVTDNASFACPS